MSYWGYSGCVDKVTWEVHRAVTGFARPWVTSLWGGVIADKDRPWVEEQLDCKFRSPNGSLAPPSPWYSINFFPFKSIFGLRACLDFGAAFPAQMAQMIATGRAVSSPAVLAPNGRLGFLYAFPMFRRPVAEGASREEVEASVAGFIGCGLDVGLLVSHALIDVLHNDSDIFSLQLFDITEPAQPVPLNAPNDSSQQPPNLLFTSPNPAFPSLNYSVVEPFPEPVVGRHIQAYCSHLVPGSTWALLYAPLLLALLVLLVSALLSVIILVLRRKGAAIRAEMSAAEEYTLLLERAERAKSESIACLSHDLRTPFNGMLGMMDELLDTQLEEWQMRDVVDARTYAASVIGLLSTILDLAKLQADMLELDSVPFSLHQCLETAARSLFADAQDRHLECESGREGLVTPSRARYPAMQPSTSGACPPIPAPPLLFPYHHTSFSLPHAPCSVPPQVTPSRAHYLAKQPTTSGACPPIPAPPLLFPYHHTSFSLSHAPCSVPPQQLERFVSRFQENVVFATVPSGRTRWGRESRRVWGRVTGRVWGNKGRGGGGGRGGGRGVSGGEGGGECEGGGRRLVRGRDRGRGGERGKGDGRNGTGQHWEGRDVLTVLKPIVSAPWSVFQRWFGFSGRSGGGGDGRFLSIRGSGMGNGGGVEEERGEGVGRRVGGDIEEAFMGDETGDEVWSERGGVEKGVGARVEELDSASAGEERDGGEREGEEEEEYEYEEDEEAEEDEEELGFEPRTNPPDRSPESAKSSQSTGATRRGAGASLAPGEETGGATEGATGRATERAQGGATRAMAGEARAAGQRVVGREEEVVVVMVCEDTGGSSGKKGMQSGDEAVQGVTKGMQSGGEVLQGQEEWSPYPVRFLLSTGLVRLMRGSMGVASEEGVGTTILVSLPLRARHLAGDDTSPVDEATAGDAGPWLEARRSVLGSVRGKRALVVDGMKLRREAVSECLRYLGISVAVAATAGQAGFLLAGFTIDEGKEWSSETAAEEERKGEEGEEERNGEEGGEGEDGEEGEEGEEGEQRSWDVVFIEADAFGPATGFGFGKRVISHWQHQQHPGGRETPPPSPTTPHPSSFPSSSSNPSVSPPPALLSTPLPLRSPHPLSTSNPLPTPHPLPTSNSLPTPWPLPQLLASVSHPPLVLTGRSACEGVQARAAGFSDVLARPWMASDAARLLQEMFAPPPAGSVSAAHSAPAQEQEEDLPQQLFSRLALEDASSVLREMLGGREVLVVDDNAVNRVVARKSLVGLGARVEVAASGELALQRLLHPHAFVLALVDINMPPGIDGVVLLVRLVLLLPLPLLLLLVGLGARVEVAASGELALQRLLHPHSFVLALVDINMPPGIDGWVEWFSCFDTCRHIRTREALANPLLLSPPVPLSFLHPIPSFHSLPPSVPPSLQPQPRDVPPHQGARSSADLDARIRKACEQAGMDGAISKPIVAQDLLTVLRSAGFAGGT
ncbi:unnamed protein product [Closterium sp. Naga37s-1]|nr:unnamed protein product [Closterium sp. Naga37s-1]